MQQIGQFIARRRHYAAAAAISLIAFAIVTHVWRADLRIPFQYALGGDGLGAARQFKEMSEFGWIYWNPLMSWPFGQDSTDFPVLNMLHLVIERVELVFVHNPFLALNLFYIALCPLASMTALFVLLRVGIRTSIAVPVAVLYSTLFSFWARNEAHLYLASYWVVPLAVLMLLQIARGNAFVEQRATGWRPTRTGIMCILAAFLIALDHVYHAAFALFILPTAVLLGIVRSGSIRPLYHGLAVAATIFIGVFVNASPTLIHDAMVGPNALAVVRYPQEAQVYGLQLAELLLPTPGNRINELASVSQTYANVFPILVNENRFAALGTVTSIGFIALFVSLIYRIRWALPVDLESSALLCMTAVAVATIGGIGALINTFVTADIRAYNRMSIFIAFFSLIAVAYLLQRFVMMLEARGMRPLAQATVWIVMIVGVFDQSPRAGVYFPFAADAAMFNADKAFITSIDRVAPQSAGVYEFPHVSVPLNPPVNGWEPQREVIGYLHSDTRGWSYGAMDGRLPGLAFDRLADEPLSEEMARALMMGFGGALVFRDAYVDDAKSLEAQLSRLSHTRPIVSADGHMAFYSFAAPLAAVKRIFTAAGTSRGVAAALGSQPLISWGVGYYPEESGANGIWRWTNGPATMTVSNLGDAAARADISATFVSAGPPATITAYVSGREIGSTRTDPLERHHFVFDVAAGGHVDLVLQSNVPGTHIGNDSRTLNFMVLNYRVQFEGSRTNMSLASIERAAGWSEANETTKKT